MSKVPSQQGRTPTAADREAAAQILAHLSTLPFVTKADLHAIMTELVRDRNATAATVIARLDRLNTARQEAR